MPTGHRAGSLERSKTSTRLSDTFKKMKLRRLLSKSSMHPPSIKVDACQSSQSVTPLDPEDSSSGSSAMGSSGLSTVITNPSSGSQSSLLVPSRTRPRFASCRGGRLSPKPQSESFRPCQRHPTITSVSSPALSPSPRAPRIHSIADHQYVHQNILLVSGEAGSTEPCGNGSNGTVVVHHHLDRYPATKWPVCNGYFKALVRLDPGPNRVRFEYISTKSASFSSGLTINNIPLTANPPLHLVVLTGSDSTDIQGPSAATEATRRDQCGRIDIAAKRLRMAGYLLQAFTGDQLYQNRMGRRCFRFEEEWAPDSLSNSQNPTMTNIAKIHVVRAETSIDEIRGLEAAGNGNAIRELVRDAVDGYFGRRYAERRYIAVVVLDAIGDLRLPGIKEHSSLAGGLGIVGSKGFHSIPTSLEGIPSVFTNCTRIGTDVGASDSFETSFIWEAVTITLGNLLEAFVSPQGQVVARSFEHLNRSFVTREPYSLRTKSLGLSPSMPKDEDAWPRIDYLRMRLHPCFRLPADPMPPEIPEMPHIFALETGLVAAATSGIVLIMVFVSNVYSDCFDLAHNPEREVFINEKMLRIKIPDLPKTLPQIKLRILSAGQGEITVDDFTAVLKGSKIQLPNGYGVAYKSGTFRSTTVLEAAKRHRKLVLHSVIAGSLLIGVRIYYRSYADGIEFIYEDKSTQLFGTRSGGSGSSADFTIDARKGEILLGFALKTKGSRRGLEILTSFGRRSGFFGGPESGGTITTLIPPKGRIIAGVSGSCVDDFVILYK